MSKMEGNEMMVYFQRLMVLLLMMMTLMTMMMVMMLTMMITMMMMTMMMMHDDEEREEKLACKTCHWQRSKVADGQARLKLDISPVSSSVRITCGPSSGPLPEKAFSGMRPFKSRRPE